MEERKGKRELSSIWGRWGREGLRVLQKGPIVAFGVVLYFMYILTVGGKMFPEGVKLEGESAEKISTWLFVWSSLASQLIHWLLSSFSVGVMTSPVTESFLSSRELCRQLMDSLPAGEVYPTLLFCMSVSAVLTGAIFGGMYVLGGDRLIKRLPCSFSNSLFVVLGLLGVQYANERLGAISLPVRPLVGLMLFNGLGAGLTGLFAWARGRYPLAGRYSVLWIALGSTEVFYLGVWYYGMSIDSLIARGWFNRDPRVPETFSLPLPAVKEINYWAAVRHSRLVLESVLVNLLQFPINFPPTVNQTKVKARARQELLVNAVANVVTSGLGCSSYLLPASTIMVRRAGSSAKIDTVLIGGGMAVCFLCWRQYFEYLPFIVFDLLLLFLAMNIVLNTAIEVVTKAPRTIPMVVVVAGVAVVTQNILASAVVAGGLSAVIALLRQKQRQRLTISDN